MWWSQRARAQADLRGYTPPGGLLQPWMPSTGAEARIRAAGEGPLWSSFRSWEPGGMCHFRWPRWLLLSHGNSSLAMASWSTSSGSPESPQTSLHVWSGRCRSQRPWWQVTRHRDTGGLRWRGWQLVGRLFVKGRWCLLVAARQWPGCPCPSHCPHHSLKDGSTWVTGGPGSGPGTPHSGPHSILLPAPLCSVRGLRQWAAGRRPWPSLGGWRPSLCAWLL